jgi:hypothetical protein
MREVIMASGPSDHTGTGGAGKTRLAPRGTAPFDKPA